LYHVITRGNRRQGIFLDEKDIKKLLAFLTEYKYRHPFRLYAYALMKNVRKDKPFKETLTRMGENLAKGRKRKHRISVA
jgi:hypothetical protein